MSVRSSRQSSPPVGRMQRAGGGVSPRPSPRVYGATRWNLASQVPAQLSRAIRSSARALSVSCRGSTGCAARRAGQS
eukprot:6212499-Pleurochrysis_carterae.AAC.3